MIICHCRVVNDKEIREEIESGASTVDEVTQRCGAGSDCGGCHGLIDDLLECRPERLAVA